MKKIIIYDLSCPLSGNIRYIGKTSRTIEERLTQHISDTKRKNNHVQCWIKNLLNKNLLPVINIIDEVNENEWIFWEQHYISLFKFLGFDLCNHTIGGEKPCNANSKEAILKRLNTLKTSEAWANKHKTHSVLMKERYKLNLINFRYNELSEEQKLKRRRLHSLKMKENYKKDNSNHLKAIKKVMVSVSSIDENGNIIKTFESANEAKRYYNFSDSTNIIKVCKGKIKSGKTKGIRFKYTKDVINL
jgi:predicted DNA binding CopG/RHH family protein